MIEGKPFQLFGEAEYNYVHSFFVNLTYLSHQLYLIFFFVFSRNIGVRIDQQETHVP